MYRRYCRWGHGRIFPLDPPLPNGYTVNRSMIAVSGVCRSVVNYGGGQGQSGQAIKLFLTIPYVSDFQTHNNSGSRQPLSALEN